MLAKWSGGIDARRGIFPEHDYVGEASQFLNVSMIVSLFSSYMVYNFILFLLDHK